jgi:methylmalonyl-CoA/ethylmalonyl-CoA epimerase
MTPATWQPNGSMELQDRADPTRAYRVGPLLGGKATLHHLGFVVASISAVAEGFAMSMSARWDGKIIYDPLQQVRVAFFSPGDTRNPVFELVEPASEVSPVTNFLKKRVGLHHICYEVDDLESGLEQARGVGFAVASDPKPAVAFDGRRIAWVRSRSHLLIEFLERQQK